jgi:hypothetical protein
VNGWRFLSMTSATAHSRWPLWQPSLIWFPFIIWWNAWVDWSDFFCG